MTSERFVFNRLNTCIVIQVPLTHMFSVCSIMSTSLYPRDEYSLLLILHLTLLDIVNCSGTSIRYLRMYNLKQNINILGNVLKLFCIHVVFPVSVYCFEYHNSLLSN